MTNSDSVLTYERLTELLSYDAETGVFRWKIRPSNRAKIGAVAGNLHSSGYRYISIDRRLYRAHRLAWLYILGVWPRDMIDHIDGNRANNRFSNLREASNAENQRNQNLRVDNKSGFKGVRWDDRYAVWKAEIQVEGRHRHLGHFSTAKEAVAAYDAASLKFHGKFAMTNAMIQRRQLVGRPMFQPKESAHDDA